MMSCTLSTWIAFLILLEENIFFKDFSFQAICLSFLIILPVFWALGIYRTIFRYTSFSIIFLISTSLTIYGFLYFLIIGVFGMIEIPRSIGILQPIILYFFIISSRLISKFILTANYQFKKDTKKNILIYGAGETGRNLALSLENSLNYKTIAFIDDDKHLSGQKLLGKTVYNSSQLRFLEKKMSIDFVILAVPDTGRNERNHIINNLSKYKYKIKTLPSFSQIINGQVSVSDIKDYNINDLINREEVKPDQHLLNKNINEQTVLVTGGGGSIGSELCRQIIKCKPKRLLILELSEFALFKIYEELLGFKTDSEIIPLLANSQDLQKLEIIFETFKVDTVYHVAAYKHVSIVEENICEGVKNNVFSSVAVAEAAASKKVSNFVLISSDKAVRPTNIMGASKRLSELYVQAISCSDKNIVTNFSIVRFGNVLESSGSVIPKFKKQIKEGGPVELTHEEVVRYFMTVSEASQLIMQAGAMGKNAEVFILDMDKGIKIKDLIYKMVSLSGLSVKNSENPDGDIEIKIIGLRPGEKLYEELLIGDNLQKTEHRRIFKSSEAYIPLSELCIHFSNLKKLLENNDALGVKTFLGKVLKLYKSNSGIIDNLYIERYSPHKSRMLDKNKNV